MQLLSKKQLVFISFMLFSMFFGAGNLIFPAFLGRASGEEIWLSMFGFITKKSCFIFGFVTKKCFSMFGFVTKVLSLSYNFYCYV